MPDNPELRARMILRDIYARHGIPEGTPPDAAVEMIYGHAAQSGDAPAAWANENERGRAQAEYASVGKTPQEVRARLDESAYLMDPYTYKYMQNYARDADFASLYGAAQGSPDDSNAIRAAGAAGGAGIPATTPKQAALKTALDTWDSSNNARVYRTGVTGSPYHSAGGIGAAVADAVSNPDVPFGNYVNWQSVIPNFVRMQGSGEPDTAGESYRRAQAVRLANNRYRPNSLAPVLNLPNDASLEDRIQRAEEIRSKVASARVPNADERWQRTVGFVPPGWITDPIDFAIDSIDPTVLIPTVGHGKNMLGALTKAGKVVGSGWLKPTMASAGKAAAKDIGTDQMHEQAVNAALVGSMGGADPSRTMRQWALGGEPVKFKSPEEVASARRDADDLYSTLKDDDGLSRADDKAYTTLVTAGLLKPRPAGWSMSSGNKQ